MNASIPSYIIRLSVTQKEIGDLLLTCLSPSFMVSHFPSYRVVNQKGQHVKEGLKMEPLLLLLHFCLFC